jgi:2-C-methyl-D-erythritol 4-phosphate cytidylyltransferase
VSTVALVLAAGAGTRLGQPAPKGFVSLGGRPIFAFAVEALAASGVVDSIVLVVPPPSIRKAEELVRESGSSVDAVVAGGRTRQQSVQRALTAVGSEAEAIVCHDAARPFASPDLVRRVTEGLVRADGVVPIIPSPDTVKRTRHGWILATMDREELGLAQTPQAFASHALRSAHSSALDRGIVATDDAMLLEEAGFRVAAVDGEATNFKITDGEDLKRALHVIEEFQRLSEGR